MGPLLGILADEKPHTTKEMIGALSDHFNLSEQERTQRLNSGNQCIIDNRVGWARTYLKKAGLITNPKRGVLEIAERGKQALQSGAIINNAYLKQFDSFLAFQNVSTNKNTITSTTDLSDDEQQQTPQEVIEQAHNLLNNDLADELLEIIRSSDPQFFERLVVKLMLAMGYGGWSAESGKATQYTADGGIDGIINEDPLGLETIYLQAKRYKEGNTVGRPDIQAFSGALDMQRARKGVFITTSSFSKDALDYVQRIDKKIILIDGQQLTGLMIKHNLGVSVKETYQIKTLDTDFFNED